MSLTNPPGSGNGTSSSKTQQKIDDYQKKLEEEYLPAANNDLIEKTTAAASAEKEVEQLVNDLEQAIRFRSEYEDINHEISQILAQQAIELKGSVDSVIKNYKDFLKFFNDAIASIKKVKKEKEKSDEAVCALNNTIKNKCNEDCVAELDSKVGFTSKITDLNTYFSDYKDSISSTYLLAIKVAGLVGKINAEGFKSTSEEIQLSVKKFKDDVDGNKKKGVDKVAANMKSLDEGLIKVTTAKDDRHESEMKKTGFDAIIDYLDRGAQEPSENIEDLLENAEACLTTNSQPSKP
ncbi:MAG: hypothetical protein AAGC85_21975 [Bacteroidota bacterium]